MYRWHHIHLLCRLFSVIFSVILDRLEHYRLFYRFSTVSSIVWRCRSSAFCTINKVHIWGGVSSYEYIIVWPSISHFWYKLFIYKWCFIGILAHVCRVTRNMCIFCSCLGLSCMHLQYTLMIQGWSRSRSYDPMILWFWSKVMMSKCNCFLIIVIKLKKSGQCQKIKMPLCHFRIWFCHFRIWFSLKTYDVKMQLFFNHCHQIKKSGQCQEIKTYLKWLKLLVQFFLFKIICVNFGHPVCSRRIPWSTLGPLNNLCNIWKLVNCRLLGKITVEWKA